jgi:fructokinase
MCSHAVSAPKCSDSAIFSRICSRKYYTKLASIHHIHPRFGATGLELSRGTRCNGGMKIGIDLGGTKIEGVVLSQTGTELARLRVATPVGDYTATLDAIRSLIADLSNIHDIPNDMPVGVGIPGTVSPRTGLVKNANSTCLIGEPLDKDLERHLARPVRLANDADCFTVSEATDGAGKGHRVVFGVILGTGVGGGLAIDGQPWVGPNAITGEWGHNPLPWPHSNERPGPPCYCGKNGCIETFISGPGLEADLRYNGGSVMSAQDIAAAGEAGDNDATAALKRYAQRLARALATVINIIDPEVIVLGGGLSNLDDLYQQVPELWQEWVFSDHCKTKLLKNLHGDSSGVRGAAWLWP